MFPSPTLGLVCLLRAFWTTVWAATDSFNLQPFTVDLSDEFHRLHTLVDISRLPSRDMYPEVGVTKGIELATLSQLRHDWLTDFDWETQQAELNQVAQYTAEIEGLTIHFVHEKSLDPDAISIMLIHGWTGSFQEFLPVVQPLTRPWKNATGGKVVSYNVVVPTLPGFLFSTPPANESWTFRDSARVYNTLMTEVLGYSTYALHGTDWGAIVGYELYANYNASVSAGHFVMLPFLPPTAEQLAAENITLTPDQQVSQNLFLEWSTTGNGYFIEQSTKPNNLGLALYDSPVGQLAWMGSFWKNMSDPNAGTPPSLLTNKVILTSVSLYFLTSSFYSSIWIYEQNLNPLNPVYSKPATDAPLFVSQFKYNHFFWPEEYAAKAGNLVSYKYHDRGGHFVGWDNPDALIADIREMGLHLVS